jgi:hypothetical protein
MTERRYPRSSRRRNTDPRRAFWRSTIRASGLFILCGVLVACWERATLPDNAVPFDPPPVYAHWWAMAEQCSGLTAPMGAVSWYQVPGVSQFSVRGAPAAGEWLTTGNRIVLADSASRDGGTVRHEMLHALLQRGGHERAYFLGRCAGVVVCPKECIADAEPSHVPLAPLVTPESLEIGVVVDPVRPSMSIDEGYFTVTVTARNSAAHPVMLPATSAYNGPAQTFGYVLQGPAGGIGDVVRVLDSAEVYFAARESKIQVFDFAIGSNIEARQLPPGSYFLRAQYGSHSITMDSLMIGP